MVSAVCHGGGDGGLFLLPLVIQMLDKKDEAIVLRGQPWGESDLLVQLFCHQGGKQKALVKGAKVSKKRFGTCLDLGSILQVVYQESPRREWVMLREAQPLTKKLAWREAFAAIVIGSYCLELASRLLPEQKESPEKFVRLRQLLLELDEKNGALQLIQFEWDWIVLSGWRPDLSHCGVCGLPWQESEHWQWRLDRGEVLCPKCRQGERYLIPRDWDQNHLPLLQGVFDDYWEYLLGKPLVSKQLLEKVILEYKQSL